jgi:DNA-binding transcriptional LysR family regulator
MLNRDRAVDLLAHLATFVRIVDTGSLSGAARSLGVSLPAVSRQLRSLEKQLGLTLVVRSTRRLSVTEDGRQWYGRATRVLAELEEGRRASGSSHGVRGTLVVSAAITLGNELVVPRLARLHRTHPDLRIDLRLEDRVVDLVGDGVDVALRGGVAPPDTTSFVAIPVLRFQRVLVASPTYLRKRAAVREPEQLVGHDCLTQLGPAGPLSRWRFVRGADERTVQVDGPIRTNAPLALRDLAVAGLGFALLAKWLLGKDLEAGRLRRTLPDWETPDITIWSIYRSELRGSPRIRAFLEAIRPR